ncbi:WD repeat-containing protein 82-B, putative [Entamoeba dispar SAW760]|uniref:WD repeat-containing protein 82-B, putative n=1 Tax=Entamoeba dispar (strain ATCC PRA-260 / SAW760) TaxID=370354 RepID=B0ESJ1_ENTDS|nr:WD repeat-containing protein 82-B, putative [Entamoeba dispar SAW760]EDR22485.1 WD repeat-containing protein 82-B, putative [Entamoeba dispar SAW760]|eukprot:EDR22485.1 WD repeat-containing protein 82-B, putative [Entamoeba dispar SAW760]
MTDNKIEEIERYKKSFVYSESEYEYVSSAFSYDGEIFVTSGGDNTYRIHSLSNPKEPTILKSQLFGSGMIKYTHHPHVILTSFNNRGILNSLGLLCFDTKEFVRVFHGHTDEIISIDHNNSSDMFLSTSLDSHVMLWDPRANNPCTSNIFFGKIFPVACFNNEGTKVVVIEENNGHVFDLKKFPYEPLFNFVLPTERSYRKVTCSLDGSKVAVSSPSGNIFVIENFESTAPIIRPISTKLTKDSPCIEFSVDGSRLMFSSGFDGSVNVFNCIDHTTIPMPQSNQTTVRSIKCNYKYPIVATTCSVVNWWSYDD